MLFFRGTGLLFYLFLGVQVEIGIIKRDTRRSDCCGPMVVLSLFWGAGLIKLPLLLSETAP